MGTNQGTYDSDLLVAGAQMSSLFHLHFELEAVIFAFKPAKFQVISSAKSQEPFNVESNL